MTNQVRKGAVLSYIELFLGVLISLIIHPIIIPKIGPSENGIFHMAINAISYLNLLTLGLGSTFIRFYTKYKVNGDVEGEHKLNGLFFVFYFIIAVVMALAGGIIIWQADNIFNFQPNEIVTLQNVMVILLVQSCLSLLATVFTMNINAREKFVFAKIVGIVSSICLAIGKIVIVMYGYKAMGLAYMTLLISVLTMIAQGVYALFNLKIKFKFGRVEKGLVKAIFTFSFFIFLNQIIDMINWQIDTLILGVVLPKDVATIAVAVYSMATILNSYVLSFSQALSSVLVPRVNNLILGGGSKEEVDKLFVKTGRVQFVLIACIMLAYIFFGKPFIVNFFAEKGYEETYYIGLLIILPLVVPIVQSVGIEILRAYNKHQLRSVAYFIMAMVNLAMSIPLGKYYGGIGCAIGTCVSLIVGDGIIMNICYHKKLGMNMWAFWKGIFKFIPALLLPTAVGVVLMLYADLSNLGYFIISVIGFVVVYAISMYCLGLNKAERERVNNKIKNIMHKKQQTNA